MGTPFRRFVMSSPRRLLMFFPMLAAWLMFFTSFFLPATNVVERGGTPPGTPLPGWDAFFSSLTVLAAQPFIVIAEPRALLLLAFPFINAAMIVIPLVALREPELAPWYGSVLVPLGLIPWLLPKTLTGDLFIGFYLWNVSFFAMAAGCVWFGLADDWCWRHATDRLESLRGDAAYSKKRHDAEPQ
jgi:hypothetical protein